MIDFLPNSNKLSNKVQAAVFASFLCSSALLVFGILGQSTFQKGDGASANSPTAPVDLESGMSIFPDEDFSIYFPTISPTLSPSMEGVHLDDTFYPTSSTSANGTEQPTQQPVASPISSTPSRGPSQLPSRDPSQIPSQPPSTFTPTMSPSMPPSMLPTVQPTTSPVRLATQIPSPIPTSTSIRPSPIRSSKPSISSMPTQTTLSEHFLTHDEPNQTNESFFNYNTSMGSRYGPHSWGNVAGLNSTENYWHEFGFVMNECSKAFQSPIDLCTQPVRHCQEYHEFRAKRGDFKISSEVVEKQILPNKLRAKMMRRIGDEPDPPHVDFAGVGYANLDLLNIDIKIPAEHRICGKQYDAEMQYYLFHPMKQKLIAVSWLFDAQPGNLVNQHLQLLIDEFQKVYDGNEASCNNANTTTATANQHDDESVVHNATSTTTSATGTNRNRRVKKVREPIWDPFHPDIQRTVHFWGYRGSLTEPPCSQNSVLWRIMDVAVPISTSQLSQLKRILFQNRDPITCEFTSTHYNGSVARPISKSKGIHYYKCTRSNYVSDDERDLCGDSGCLFPFGRDLDPYFEPIVHVTGPPSESPTSVPSILPTEV